MMKKSVKKIIALLSAASLLFLGACSDKPVNTPENNTVEVTVDDFTAEFIFNENGLIEKEKKFGRNSERIGMIREKAINDRINAIPYDPDKYENEIDKNNYQEGFFAMGNRALHGRLESLSDEQLQAIGANDYISGVLVSDELKEFFDYIINMVNNDIKGEKVLKITK